MNEQGDLVYTIPETARLLKVSEMTVLRLIKRGQLPAVKVGRKYTRIMGEDLRAFLSKHRKA